MAELATFDMYCASQLADHLINLSFCSGISNVRHTTVVFNKYVVIFLAIPFPLYLPSQVAIAYDGVIVVADFCFRYFLCSCNVLPPNIQ